MKTRLQQGFTLIELLVVITIIAILASLAVPTFSKIQERGNITKGISNARQIITTLRLYSSDNNSNYPDNDKETSPTDANGAFRVLFRESLADNESIFGCPVSQFTPDGNIGSAPEYTEAVSEGENHWAMTAGLSDSASGSIPLVYENPVSATWNPTWNTDAKGTTAAGRAWSNGIIVGMNDSSVQIQPLAGKTGNQSLKDLGDGKNAFTTHDTEGGEERTVLGVAGGK